MRLWIEMYGYQAIEATNGVEAVGCVKNARPDLVLIDVSLPVMDGITATKLIRDLENGKDIPVIAVAGNDMSQEQALQAGCDKVISKPIDFKNVLQIISYYLSI